jgi:hypothetical protein
MKTARLTKNQLTKLKENGRLWGRKYYYEMELPGIVKYHEIYYTDNDQSKRLMNDEYAKHNNLWEYRKIN